jgi:hypothetical protein
VAPDVKKVQVILTLKGLKKLVSYITTTVPFCERKFQWQLYYYLYGNSTSIKRMKFLWQLQYYQREISHTTTLLPFRRHNFHTQLHYHLSDDAATTLLGLFSIAALHCLQMTTLLGFSASFLRSHIKQAVLLQKNKH